MRERRRLFGQDGFVSGNRKQATATAKAKQKQVLRLRRRMTAKKGDHNNEEGEG
jgi:hypothetical protein